MKRQEAERLIGKTVACWTALRGCYIGELIEYPVQGLSDFSAGFKMRKPAGFDNGDVPDLKSQLLLVTKLGKKMRF